MPDRGPITVLQGDSNLADSPSVKHWLDKVTPGYQVVRRSWFKISLCWLRKQNGWEKATPESLLSNQEKAVGRDRYVILDLIQKHVRVRRHKKRHALTILGSEKLLHA